MSYYFKNNGDQVLDITDVNMSTCIDVSPDLLAGESATWSDDTCSWVYINKHQNRLTSELQTAKDMLIANLEAIYIDPLLWNITVNDNNNVTILTKPVTWISNNLTSILTLYSHLSDTDVINLNIYFNNNALSSISCSIEEAKQMLSFCTITFSINMRQKKIAITEYINSATDILDLYNINILQEFKTVNNIYTLSN